MNKENAFINIYAGRPGSGKTLWARQEIAALMGDANNFVVYIGHADEMNYLEEMTKEKPGKLFLSKDTHFGQTIGTAIDMANYATENESSDESEEMQNNRKQVYIFATSAGILWGMDTAICWLLLHRQAFVLMSCASVSAR